MMMKNEKCATMYNVNCFDFIPTMDDVDVVLTTLPKFRSRGDEEKYVCSYYDFMCSLTESLLEKTRKCIVLRVTPTPINKDSIYRFLAKYSKKVQEVFICGKRDNSYEMCIVIGHKRFNNKINNMMMCSNLAVKHIEKVEQNRSIAMELINRYTAPNDVVYDPFMGLGDVAIACKRLNRDFVGTEIDEYLWKCAIVKARND